jgi:hypothetical protein
MAFCLSRRHAAFISWDSLSLQFIAAEFRISKQLLHVPHIFNHGYFQELGMMQWLLDVLWLKQPKLFD